MLAGSSDFISVTSGLVDCDVDAGGVVAIDNESVEIIGPEFLLRLFFFLFFLRTSSTSSSKPTLNILPVSVSLAHTQPNAIQLE